MNWASLIVNYRLKLFLGILTINLVATPLSHVAGEVAQAVFAEGGVNVILKKPDPTMILAGDRAVSRHESVRPTDAFTHDAFARRRRKHDYSSLRHLMYWCGANLR